MMSVWLCAQTLYVILHISDLLKGVRYLGHDKDRMKIKVMNLWNLILFLLNYTITSWLWIVSQVIVEVSSTTGEPYFSRPNTQSQYKLSKICLSLSYRR